MRFRREKAVRWLALSAIASAGAYLVLSAGLYWAMRQTPERFGRIMKSVPLPFMIVLPFEPLWMRARAGQIRTGEAAPDFALPLLDHSGAVRLSSFRGDRPVVLVFGSYT